MRDLTVEESKIPAGKQIKCHLSPIGSHLLHYVKSLTCKEDDQLNILITTIAW